MIIIIVIICGDRDETRNHIISECSKLQQKDNKTRQDWVGKVIHWELFKKLKFDHTNKWYMDNLEYVRENNTHKLVWDFEIQKDHLISFRRPGHIIINKNESTGMMVDLAVSADHRVELKECEKRNKDLDITRELKKTGEHENEDFTNCNWCSWYSHQRLRKVVEDVEITGRVETVQLQHFWDRPEYWEESWRLGKTCCHSNSSGKPPANADGKIVKD